MCQVEPRLGQGRSGKKWKTLKLSVSSLHDKTKQPQLSPGRRPIIHIAERPILTTTSKYYTA